MIACVSPGITSANHTINTLRYSDRLKEKSSTMKLGDLNLLIENNFNLKLSSEINNNKIEDYEVIIKN
jgi:kinesin family protein 2/24